MSYLRGRSTSIARLAWLAVAAFMLVLWLTGFISEWSGLSAVCHSSAACANGGGLDAQAARSLTDRGISLAMFAASAMAIQVVFLVIWFSLGALIIWRKPQDPGALLAAYFLAIFPLFLNSGVPFSFAFLALILFGLLFPDARFVPQWTRWLALIAGVSCLVSFLWKRPAVVACILILVVAVAMQIYRFRTVSLWRQRQQTKWAMLGFTATIVGFFGSVFLAAGAGNGSLVSTLVDALAFWIVISVMPVSIGISVLRSGLWDIDRVISRALAYSALSLILAGIYIGSVIGLQALIGLVVGNSSALAIVVSTLVIAALFGPLRRRIQVVIDRRFYRAKYDAARTLAAFGDRLRDQVDIDRLSREMSAVVHETLHPEHVSLWLRGS